MKPPETAPSDLPARPFSRDFLNATGLFYVMAVGIFLILAALSTDYLGVANNPGFGPGQWLMAGGGLTLLLLTAGWDMLRGQQKTKLWARQRLMNMGGLIRLGGIALPLGVLILAIRQFHLENEAFFNTVLALTFAGFLIHYFLPDAFRLPFFVLLSLAGIIAIMGVAGGAWLIGVGLTLLLLANLPLRPAIRVLLLLVAAAALVLLRSGALSAPWPNAIWPILGSMFFVRLIIYVYDSKDPQARFSLGHTLAYFFLLPNVVFPLFPPIDYTNFRRGYYKGSQFAIYQKGVTWIAWGTINLLAYRFINYYLVLTEDQVTGVVTLAQYFVTTVLLYLRVIGQAYIILGICGLFGFDLPRPFDSMYLASSFTDFWRRANIYWKDFMQKVFFYPVFFALRKRGTTFALVIATLVNFVIAWFLHASQWFWLRSSFLITLTDSLFWALLGVFVLYNVLKETKKRPVPAARQAATRRGLLRLALYTSGFFIALNLLWTMWTSPSLAAWWGLLTVPAYNAADWLSLAGILLCLFGVITAALWFEYRAKPALLERIQPKGDRSPAGFYRTALLLSGTAAALFLLSSQAVINRSGGPVQTLLLDMRVARLSNADSIRLQRGYYENLMGVNNFNSELWEVYTQRPADWPAIYDTELVYFTGDYREYAFLPSVSTNFHGAVMSTNSTALRDKEYTIEKPPDTYRFAWLGSSRTMGSGVNDWETFEWLIEDRLNQEMVGRPYDAYESLNFSVGGYTVLQRLAALDAVWAFEPDVLIYVPHPTVEKLRTYVHIQHMLNNGVANPFPELAAIIQQAGVTPGMSDAEATRLLDPYGDEILAWAYGEFVAAAQAHGAIPVWLNYAELAERVVETEDPANMQRIAAAAGFVTISLDDVFDGYDRDTLVVAEWDAHPNTYATRILADAIYAALLENWDTLVVAR